MNNLIKIISDRGDIAPVQQANNYQLPSQRGQVPWSFEGLEKLRDAERQKLIKMILGLQQGMGAKHTQFPGNM